MVGWDVIWPIMATIVVWEGLKYGYQAIMLAFDKWLESIDFKLEDY